MTSYLKIFATGRTNLKIFPPGCPQLPEIQNTYVPSYSFYSQLKRSEQLAQNSFKQVFRSSNDARPPPRHSRVRQENAARCFRRYESISAGRFHGWSNCRDDVFDSDVSFPQMNVVSAAFTQTELLQMEVRDFPSFV